MAFPTVQSTSSDNTSQSTSHTVTMPTGLTSGDLIVVVWCNDGGADVTGPTGYTKVVELDNGSAMSGAILYKVSDGTEGASQTFTTSSSETGAYVVYRITGHNSAVEATINNDDGSGDQTTTTWAVDSLTPSWGADDTLWIVSLHSQGHNGSANDTVSSGYGNVIETARSSNNAVALIGSGRLENNTATESPADCTTPSAVTRACASLVGIQPGSSGGGGGDNALAMCNF